MTQQTAFEVTTSKRGQSLSKRPPDMSCLAWEMGNAPATLFRIAYAFPITPIMRFQATPRKSVARIPIEISGWVEVSSIAVYFVGSA